MTRLIWIMIVGLTVGCGSPKDDPSDTATEGGITETETVTGTATTTGTTTGTTTTGTTTGTTTTGTTTTGTTTGTTTTTPTTGTSTTDTTSTTTPSVSGSNRIVAYFVEWGIYARDYQVADIPASQITHINYAFVDLTAAGECVIYDEWAALGADGGTFAQIRELRGTYPHLKVLMSVGGWTLSTHFPAAASTPDSRTAMVESCVDFMITHGFDGIDIDWEYPVAGGLTPGTDADTANYTLLMAEFREALDALGEGHLLTIASPAGPTTIGYFDLPGLDASLDWFNVMTYDMHGTWEDTTNFQAPLYPSSSSPSADEALMNVDAALQTYLDAGVPSDKIVMGIPFYGRGWSGVPDVDLGLYQTSTGSAPGTWEVGVYDYSHLVELMADPSWVRTLHAETLVPWLYNATEGVFVTYDDPESLGHKLDYLETQGLGGVMFWELSADTDEHELLDVLHERLGD
jgi:chitinase